MYPTLPSSVHFRLLSFCLAIPPFEVSRGKLFTIVACNLILLLMEAITQYILRRQIYAFVGKPVLMLLDSVSLTGPLLTHALLIFESLIKKKIDFTIWRQISEMNNIYGVSSSSLDKIFHRDFLLISIIPLMNEIAVVLGTYSTQENWALGLISRHYSGVINRWCIVLFMYYLRYMSDRFSLMAQEIQHLHALAKMYKYASYLIVGRLNQMKANFNMLWRLHGFVQNRYEFFVVAYIFMTLCGVTAAMYFLGTRLVTRRFPYSLESALCIGPYMFTISHISVAAADFDFKQKELLNALQLLSEQNWRSPQVVSSIKSFKIQLRLANLTPTVGGHLKLMYSSLLLGVIYIVTTYLFIFLFLN